MSRWPRALGAYLPAVIGPLLLTGLLTPFAGPHQATNVAFAYLLIVLAAAARGGMGPGVVASVLGFFTFNFYFLEPRHSLTVSARGDVGVLIGFLATAVVISALVARVESRRQDAERQSADTQFLYDLSVGTSGYAAVAPRLDLSAAAVLVRHGDDVHVHYDGGQVASELHDVFVLPTDVWHIASAPLTSGGDLVVLARPHKPRGITTRQSTMLDAVAALFAAGIDRVEQQRQQRTVEVLQQTDRQRAALLSAVSHDLRTPLATITMAAGELSSGALDAAEHAALVQSISRETERLDHMVVNLLDLGRIESGALVADREPVPVEELVGAVLARVRRQIGVRKLSLSVPRELPMVLVDSVQIDQSLANLVDNVLAHTPVAAGLVVQAASRSGWVTIRVADDGPGIPAGDRSRLFERFGRGSAASSGSGLGLAIARAYAEASGGRLELAETARGAAFDLHLVAVESA